LSKYQQVQMLEVSRFSGSRITRSTACVCAQLETGLLAVSPQACYASPSFRLHPPPFISSRSPYSLPGPTSVSRPLGRALLLHFHLLVPSSFYPASHVWLFSIFLSLLELLKTHHLFVLPLRVLLSSSDPYVYANHLSLPLTGRGDPLTHATLLLSS
jgi:hypothetical protein